MWWVSVPATCHPCNWGTSPGGVRCGCGAMPGSFLGATSPLLSLPRSACDPRHCCAARPRCCRTAHPGEQYREPARVLRRVWSTGGTPSTVPSSRQRLPPAMRAPKTARPYSSRRRRLHSTVRDPRQAKRTLKVMRMPVVSASKCATDADGGTPPWTRSRLARSIDLRGCVATSVRATSEDCMLAATRGNLKWLRRGPHRTETALSWSICALPMTAHRRARSRR